MHKQKVTTPEILPCKECGEDAHIVTWDWPPRSQSTGYMVECKNRHSKTQYCGSYHRAVCLWNNRNKEN